MKEINLERISKLIHGDVELAEREARFVLIISPDGNKIQVFENENPRLNIFAIIGPAQGFGKNWDKVLLAEIGISRTRPYTEARGLSRQTNQSNLHRRRKLFYLSEQQYQLVAPIIFKMMDVRAGKIISAWRSGSPENIFWIKTSKFKWTNRSKRLNSRLTSYAVPSGIRFNVSLEDEFFIRDVFWAELSLNKRIERIIGGLARFISKRLNWYKITKYRGKRKKIDDLNGFQDVVERINVFYLKKFPHLMVELGKKLKDDSKLTSFFSYLARVLQWDGHNSRESEFASLALLIPSPKDRLGEIQILVTTDLSKSKNFITFEVQK